MPYRSSKAATSASGSGVQAGTVAPNPKVETGTFFDSYVRRPIQFSPYLIKLCAGHIHRGLQNLPGQLEPC